MIFIVTGSKVLDDNNVEYEVLDLIGSGGFGTVFKIKRTDDVTLFALKTLQIGFSQKEYIDSFRHEGEIAVKINSINVLKYLFFHDGDLYEDYPPYIIMEFAPEGSLLDLIEDQKGFFNNLKIISMFKELIYTSPVCIQIPPLVTITPSLFSPMSFIDFDIRIKLPWLYVPLKIKTVSPSDAAPIPPCIVSK